MIALAIPLSPLPAAAAMEVSEVADGVFVHAGVHVSVDDPRHADIANIGFIIGSRCVAVIDTGGSFAVGQSLLDAVRARTDREICYVINTHVHYDHVLGNAAFLGTGARFVGHAALADAMESSRAFFVERFAADLGPEPGPAAIIGPELPVDGSLNLNLGDRVLELRAHGPAHTGADLSIFDARTETLWLGDLLFMDRAPVLDGSLRGWLDVLTEVEAIRAQRVVPGHGPTSAPWPAAAAAQRRYLERILAEVRDGIARGLFMEDILESTAGEERGNWQLFDDVHRRNLTRSFTELEWE